MIKHYWLKTLVFFLLPINLIGQVKQNDLTQLSYKEIWRRCFEEEKQLPKQLKYVNIYLAKAEKEKNNFEKAHGYYMYNQLYKDDNLKVKYLDSVIKYIGNLNNEKFPAVFYSEKAYALKRLFRYKEAIDNFMLAEKYALRNNINFYYNVRQSIAIVKSENLGEVEDALVLYRECYQYYNTKDYRSKDFNPMYLEVLFDIADANKALFKTDSATYYNRLGYRESKIAKDTLMQNLFTLNEGANLVVKKKYTIAIDSINKAMPIVIAYKNKGNILASYYYLGKAYQGMRQKELALKNFIKVDSMFKIKKEITPEFVSGYPFIISYYKDKGNKGKQLEYLTTYISIDSSLQKNYKELTKKLEKEYDRPHFVKDKEALIESLKGNQYYYLWGIMVLLGLVLGAIYYGVYQQKLKKDYRTKFEKIIAESNHSNTTNRIDDNLIPNETNKNKSLVVGDEVSSKLLEKLNAFVEAKAYLKQNITLQSLSKDLETNTTYLSNIFNQYIEKSIVHYLSDLRINEAVIQLQQNKDLKKYTIQALANEFGFNNAESFSNAFHKKTGLKPSIFIKELENKNLLNN